MKNIFKLLLVSLIFTACEDAENNVFSGSADNPTFLSFESSSINFPVPRDIGGTFDLVLRASTISNVDRTYNLEIDETLSTADEALYEFPSQITIPAGQYTGTEVVKGYDVDLDAIPQTIVFSITNIQGEYIDDEIITLNLFEVCPLLESFTGRYTVEQFGGGLPTVSGNPMIFGDGLPIVRVRMGASEYERYIEQEVYPEVGGPLRTFNFIITCAGINLTDNIDLEVGCGSGPTLQFGPGLTPGFVNHEDDASFTVRLTENKASACSGTPRQTTLQFTKVVE